MKIKQYNGDFQKLEERQERISERIDSSKTKYKTSLKGGVYQPKGRNTWWVWYPWNGKKILVYQYLDGTPNYCREQAERVLEKIRAEVEEGIFDPASWTRAKTFSVEKAWNLYQEQCPCGRDRMEARERIFQDFILPYFRDKGMTQIEEHHILTWWASIPKTYQPSYLRVIRATLRAFLTFHRVTRIKMFKYPVVKVPKKTPPWLSKDEQGKILEFVPIHHQPIIHFLYAYGCRVSEAANLNKLDVDWTKDTITFRERKNDRENVLEIFDEVRSILKDTGKVTHLNLVFCSVNGERYTRQVLYRLWIDASKAANQKYGVKIVPLKNGTRHSLACQLLERGESIAMVARILGNSPSVIEKNYGSISVKASGKALRNVYIN